MVYFSLALRGNPSDVETPKKYFAVAQYKEIINLQQFAEHIASHGCVYSRADISAILTMAVDCIRELLLQGTKVQLGDLGSFWVSLKGTGSLTASDFNASSNIKQVKVRWSAGNNFKDLKKDVSFNQVPSRKVQAETLKMINQGA